MVEYQARLLSLICRKSGIPPQTKPAISMVKLKKMTNRMNVMKQTNKRIRSYL